MSSEKNNFFYHSLLKKYREREFLNPESALNHDIQSLMDEKGKTEEEIILHLYRLMEKEGKTREEAILHFHQELERAKDKTERQAIEHNTAIQSQIVKLREKIDTLTVNFSKGKISEEIYLRAVKTIEEEISKLRGEQKTSVIERQQLQAPKTNFRPVSVETTEVKEETHYYGSPSAFWWLVPFLFGLIGGIVAYIGVKDDDSDMADKLLIFGIIWTIVLFILGWILIFR